MSVKKVFPKLPQGGVLQFRDSDVYGVILKTNKKMLENGVHAWHPSEVLDGIELRHEFCAVRFRRPIKNCKANN